MGFGSIFGQSRKMSILNKENTSLGSTSKVESSVGTKNVSEISAKPNEKSKGDTDNQVQAPVAMSGNDNDMVLDLTDDLDQFDDSSQAADKPSNQKASAVSTKFIVTLNGVDNKQLLRKLEKAADDESQELDDEAKDEMDDHQTNDRNKIARSSDDLRFTLSRQPDSPKKSQSSFAERRKQLLLSMNRRTEHLKQIRQAQMLKQRLVQKRISAEENSKKSEDESMDTPPEQSDVEMATDEKDENSAQITERCRFWPNCLNKECIYVHPSQPCRNFPNCKFGSECLYIHPKCRYDAHCSRFDCPFQHSAPRSMDYGYPSPYVPFAYAPPPKGNLIRCRFHPNCQNPHCPFHHPTKPCRFGILCTSKETCLFEHPATPDRSLFKWTKYSANSIKPPVRPATMSSSESNTLGTV